MAVQKKTADKLKGFTQHGVILVSESGKNVRARCPFGTCRTKTKASLVIHSEKRIWCCKRCNKSGDFNGFLTQIMEQHQANLDADALDELVDDRDIGADTLEELGIGWCPRQKLYMIPFRIADKVTQIHRYSLSPRKLYSTTGGGRGYITLGNLRSSRVWVVEGPWDACAAREGLLGVGRNDLVIGLSGAMSGQGPELIEMTHGKHVLLAFDNDKSGAKADAKARLLLSGHAADFKSVHWPENASDGYDVRDLWMGCADDADKFVKRLTRSLRVDPRDLDEEDAQELQREHSGSSSATRRVPDGASISRREAIKRYRKWLHLPDTEVLDVIFGTAFANRMVGDPLWLFLVGPPGCGKSEILMSISNAPLTRTMTTLTPQALVSGRDGPGGVDPSIIPEIDGQLLIVKDFTPILTMQRDAREQVFGVLRDAFDGKFEKRFGNGVHRLYTSRFGIIAAVTPKIEELGSGHVVAGERFLKYYMRSPCQLNAGSRTVMKALNSINEGQESNMREALAEIGDAVLNRVVTHTPKIPKIVIDKLHKLAMWTANLRGAVTRDKYTHEILHKPVAEVGTRIAKQLAKLAIGIAIFREKKNVTIDEYTTIAKVAKSSVPDLVGDIIRTVYLRFPNKAFEVGDLIDKLGFAGQTIANIMENLVLLGIMKKKKAKGKRSLQFRLNPVVFHQMGPLGLYANELRWKRVTIKRKKGERSED